MNSDRQAWIDRARAVRIEDDCARRVVQLNGKRTHREGPCPQCGGTDRFSINTKKQAFRFRECNPTGGDVIAMVMWMDESNFNEACETLAGNPPPKNP
jgi:phage/plasmid primase-like uncharacterized protein